MLVKNVFIVLLLISLVNCARVGSPSGGPKDELPPITISAVPDFGSLHFKGNKIKINFDEYIKFKDLNKQLVISPPLKYNPEITPLGIASKSISIKLLDTLKEQTTYSFNFGNAIVDNAESNPLKQFIYVFSTGDYVDSLEVKGSVSDAYRNVELKNIAVLLYRWDENSNDSIIYQQKPDYVANTVDSSYFNLKHLKEGKYLMLALADKSQNLVFNPKEDQIGYILDPVEIPTDSTFQMRLFFEEPEFQLLNFSQVHKNHLMIGYQGKWTSELDKLYDNNQVDISFISYKDKEKDSIHIWHKPTESDSLFLTLKNESKIWAIKQRSKEIDSLNIQKSIGQILHLRDSLFLKSNVPITSIEEKLVSLYDKDSLPVDFKIIATNNALNLWIDFQKKPENKYRLEVFPGAFSDYLEQKNDSIKVVFNTKKTEDYGEIKVQINLKDTKNIIFQLLDDKNKVVQSDYIDKNTSISYTLLNPSNYKFRAIIDSNANGKWDTGNFLLKIQPEKIINFKKIIELRANWTTNEEFNID